MSFRSLCNRNKLYLLKLTGISLLALLVINIIQIRYKCEHFKSPTPRLCTNSTRSPRSEKWILMDSSDLSEHHVTLLDEQTDWAGLLMDASQSRKRLRCKTCHGNHRTDGVLEAIKNNAKFIYYADDIVSLPHELQNLKLTKLNYGLEFNGTMFHFDLKAHFKSSVKSSPLSQKLGNHYRLGGRRTPFIQTFLSRDDLLLPGESTAAIDHRAPPITLPKHYLHPFSQKATLYFYDAFWALAPVRRNQYFTWSLMTQRLLQELGIEMMVNAPPRMKTEKKQSSIAMTKVRELSAILKNWVCLSGVSFLQCVRVLTEDLIVKGHIDSPTANAIKDFINQLSVIGYKEPIRLLRPLIKAVVPPINKVIYWPSYSADRSESALDESFTGMCKSGIGECKEPSKTGRKVAPVYDNLLLVIVFNKPGYYGVIKYLENMYRPFFPHILYCGLDMDNFLSVYNLLDRKLSFIEVDFNLGQYGYQCVQKAMQMNYDVEGYIHLSDDVLLNVWNVADLPKDKIWFQWDMKVANLISDVVPDVWKFPYWNIWLGPYGQIAAKRALGLLQHLALVEKRAKDLMFTLSTNAGGTDRVYYQASDIYYIPRRFSRDFVYAASVFNTHHVHLEIAVPTIMNSLDLHENIVFMNGSYLWYKERRLYQLKYNYDHVFLHSMKLALCIAEVTCQKFICNRYLPCLYPSKTKIKQT